MPSKTADPAAVISDALLTGLKQTQELALSGVTLWSDVAEKAFALAPFETLPALSLGSPRAAVEQSFSFAQDVLATQKDFTLKLVDSLTPKSAS